MVIVSPLRIGLWDPFQMAELHGLYMGVILTTETNWDDPPSMLYSENMATLRSPATS